MSKKTLKKSEALSYLVEKGVKRPNAVTWLWHNIERGKVLAQDDKDGTHNNIIDSETFYNAAKGYLKIKKLNGTLKEPKVNDDSDLKKLFYSLSQEHRDIITTYTKEKEINFYMFVKKLITSYLENNYKNTYEKMLKELKSKCLEASLENLEI